MLGLFYGIEDPTKKIEACDYKGGTYLIRKRAWEKTAFNFVHVLLECTG
jgi:hypothetical protein